MGYELTTAGENGHIELDLPELRQGERLTLIVLRGGLLHMGDDFDAPLQEFAESS